MTVFDARKGIPFEKRTVMFDTNVWITIEGMDPSSTRTSGYGDFFAALRKSDNSLVINDYVLGEFHNRCCRLEYTLRKEASGDNNFPSFKRYRVSKDFEEFMRSMKEVCEGILADATYEGVNGDNLPIADVIDEACGGHMDLSDIILREHCRRAGHLLVTDDYDFLGCDIDLATCNERLLKQSAKSRRA